jgi:WXG100 family type VII secretion target
MANINVDYERINSTAGQLDLGREQISTQIDDLNKLINGLIADGFATTAASGAYQDAFQRYANGAKETIGGLLGLADFLRKTAQVMQATDEQIAGSIR